MCRSHPCVMTQQRTGHPQQATQQAQVGRISVVTALWIISTIIITNHFIHLAQASVGRETARFRGSPPAVAQPFPSSSARCQPRAQAGSRLRRKRSTPSDMNRIGEIRRYHTTRWRVKQKVALSKVSRALASSSSRRTPWVESHRRRYRVFPRKRESR